MRSSHAAEGEARTLLETCLEKAKSFRETLQSYGKGRRMAQVGRPLGVIHPAALLV